jgi:hypothetical protein
MFVAAVVARTPGWLRPVSTPVRVLRRDGRAAPALGGGEGGGGNRPIGRIPATRQRSRSRTPSGRPAPAAAATPDAPAVRRHPQHERFTCGWWPCGRLGRSGARAARRCRWDLARPVPRAGTRPPSSSTAAIDVPRPRHTRFGAGAARCSWPKPIPLLAVRDAKRLAPARGTRSREMVVLCRAGKLRGDLRPPSRALDVAATGLVRADARCPAGGSSALVAAPAGSGTSRSSPPPRPPPPPRRSSCGPATPAACGGSTSGATPSTPGGPGLVRRCGHAQRARLAFDRPPVSAPPRGGDGWPTEVDPPVVVKRRGRSSRGGASTPRCGISARSGRWYRAALIAPAKSSPSGPAQQQPSARPARPGPSRPQLFRGGGQPQASQRTPRPSAEERQPPGRAHDRLL